MHKPFLQIMFAVLADNCNEILQRHAAATAAAAAAAAAAAVGTWCFLPALYHSSGGDTSADNKELQALHMFQLLLLHACMAVPIFACTASRIQSQHISSVQSPSLFNHLWGLHITANCFTLLHFLALKWLQVVHDISYNYFTHRQPSSAFPDLGK